MRYFCVLTLVLVICKGEVWAESGGLPQEIREDHFAFQLPEGSRPVKLEDLSPSFFPDTPWGRVHKKRFKDLDRVFVAKEDNTFLCLGLKVRPYRKRLRKPLPYEEFASTEKIEAYKKALIDQLQRHGLTGVSVKGPVASREDGVIQFTCEFEFSEGLKSEEYYASILGSHEVVYLILFSSPPTRSSERASLFRQIVESLEFKEKYQYRPYPQNWWEERTWGERIEDILKLLALFLILYFGFNWGLESLFKSRLRVDPRVTRVMSICLSFIVCLAAFKWVEF